MQVWNKRKIFYTTLQLDTALVCLGPAEMGLTCGAGLLSVFPRRKQTGLRPGSKGWGATLETDNKASQYV